MNRPHLLLIALLLAWPVSADDFRPAYLQLTQTAPDRYDVLWKVPALDQQTVLELMPRFPDGSRELGARRASYVGGAAVIRWTAELPGGLNGKPIAFEGRGAPRTDILVRLARLDGTEQLERLSSADPYFVAMPSAGRFEVISSYTWLGVEHILLGVDHLLFVVALMLLVRGARQLLLTITAFTVAHSMTLALATLGLLELPAPPVEALIALSIVFVAVELLKREQGHASLASERPWLVAFGFGLLHGLGFAGALTEVGLPAHAIPLALLFFNVGVELGQLLFVGALLLFTLSALRVTGGWPGRRRAVTLSAYTIGGLASFWAIERIVVIGGA